MEIDTMQLDLRMESIYVRELLDVKWLNESGLVENIERVVEEYRQSRQLLVSTKEKTQNHITRGELVTIRGVRPKPRHKAGSQKKKKKQVRVSELGSWPLESWSGH